MVDNSDLRLIVTQAQEGATTRKFSQSVELTLVLKDIDVKKGFNLNEVVILPHKPTKQASICVVGTGDTGIRARKAEVDRVIQPEELDRLGTNKREARKVVEGRDFFLADSIDGHGRPHFGAISRSKRQNAYPYAVRCPIEAIADRLRKSVRIRAKNQLNASAKIGDEKLDDGQLTANASAVSQDCREKSFHKARRTYVTPW